MKMARMMKGINLTLCLKYLRIYGLISLALISFLIRPNQSFSQVSLGDGTIVDYTRPIEYVIGGITVT